MPMSKSKNILPDPNLWWKYNFDIEVIGQGQTEFMNVRDTSYHGDTLTCQTKYDFVKGQKSWGLNTKPCHKPYKFDLEVKGQCRIRIMNVLDTSSHGDRAMCQIWYANVKANRSHRSAWEHDKSLKFEFEVKGQHRIGTWINLSHLLMVIDPCAKYGQPISN